MILQSLYKKPLSFKHLMVVLIGLGVAIKINVIGELLLSEIITVSIFAYIVLFDNKFKFRHFFVWAALLFGCLWLINQVVTDLILDIAFHDYTRGWAIIIILMINVVVVYYLTRDDLNLLLLLFASLVVGLYVRAFFFPDENILYHRWKFGLSEPTVFAIGVFAPLLIRDINKLYRVAAILFVVFAVYSFLSGSRAVSGVALLAGISLTIISLLDKKVIESKILTGIFVSLAIFLGVNVGVSLYTYLGAGGFFDEEATLKFERQSAQSDGKSIITSARPEFKVLFVAISDSPIIGHGSWAKNSEYRNLYYEWKRHELDKLEKERLLRFIDRSELIPTHSHILGSWVRSGIFGGLYWFAMIVMMFLVLFRLIKARSVFLPLAILLAFSATYHIMFSPFGLQRRLIMAFILVFFVLTSTKEGLLFKLKSR